MCVLCGIYNACLRSLSDVFVAICVLCVVGVGHVCGNHVGIYFCVLWEYMHVIWWCMQDVCTMWCLCDICVYSVWFIVVCMLCGACEL